MQFATLSTQRLLLTVMSPADVTMTYVGWLNNPEITRFLEVRLAKHDIESTRSFIEAINTSNHSVLYAIKLADTRRHIGNIKLGPIVAHHSRADIGLMIGEADYWGKGYAREAIAAITGMAHNRLGLAKVTAGAYASNLGSINAFLKAGFVEEARRRSHWQTNAGWDDDVLLAHFRDAKT